MITGLLLAAGGARRFGSQKLLHRVGDKPVIRWSAEALCAGVDWAVVVVPPDSQPLIDVLRGMPIRHIVNAQPWRGMGRSIACGISAMPADADAVVVTLGDEPALEARWIQLARRTYEDRRRQGVVIVALVFQGVRRHPVLFDRGVFAELALLDGDRGARDVVDRDPGRVALVPLDEPGTLDVDTPEDLARLRQAAQFTARSQPAES